MNNFGFNLLSSAQTVIGNQEYVIKKWLGKETNSAGYDIDSYSKPEYRTGSVQPVGRSRYQHLGLDFSKLYIQIFDVDLIDVLSREENSDQIVFKGSIYKALPNFDWTNSGDWNSVLCVRIGND